MFECIVSFCYFDFFISFTYELLELMNSDTVESSYLEYSISWALLYLEQIRLFIGHLALDQSKILLVSQIPSNIFSGPFSSFLSLSSTFSWTFKTFWNFYSQISLFSTLASTVAAIVPGRRSKDSQIEFFFLFFDRMFWFDFLIARMFSKGSL